MTKETQFRILAALLVVAGALALAAGMIRLGRGVTEITDIGKAAVGIALIIAGFYCRKRPASPES